MERLKVLSDGEGDGIKFGFVPNTFAAFAISNNHWGVAAVGPFLKSC